MSQTSALMQSETAEIIDGHGIRATAEGLFEIDAGRLMAFVPRGEIVGVSLQYGPVVPRPLVQALLAGVLIVIGLSPLPFVLHWVSHGGTLVLETPWLFCLAVIGVWMLLQALRRGIYVAVETDKGNRKLAFSHRVDPPTAKAFIEQVRLRFGYRGIDGVV